MVNEDVIVGTPFHPALGVRHAPFSCAVWHGLASPAANFLLISIDVDLSIRAQSG